MPASPATNVSETRAKAREKSATRLSILEAARRLAAERGRDTQTLAQEAIERFVDYDEWFLREVEKGLAAADRGEFIEHEDIGKLINSRYPG